MGPNQTDKPFHSKGDHLKKKEKKRQPTEWEKKVANDKNDKGLISKICKQFIKLNNKKIKPPN